MLTDWYIKAGCSGIFSVCLSSEMFQVSCVLFAAFGWTYLLVHVILQLSNDERVAIARQVAQRAAGRVPVVAGGWCTLVSLNVQHLSVTVLVIYTQQHLMVD